MMFLRSVAARATHFLPAQKVGKKALMGKAPSVIQNRLTHFAFPLRTPVVISTGSVSGKHGVPLLCSGQIVFTLASIRFRGIRCSTSAASPERVRVSGGHLGEAEAPTDAAAEKVARSAAK